MYFDRKRVLRARAKAAGLTCDPGSHFLIDRVLEIMLERVSGHFDCVLDLGCHQANCYRLFKNYATFDTFVQSDFSIDIVAPLPQPAVVIDYDRLPFKLASFSLVISAMTLHVVNNLKDFLLQIIRSLKPGGIFLANLFGHNTLKELRQAIIEAESLEHAKSRIAPFIDIKDAGRLMQGCGFKFATVDSELLILRYSDIWRLFRDLRAMGETNPLLGRLPGLTTKAMLQRIVDCYPGDLATCEILVLTGMRPL